MGAMAHRQESRSAQQLWPRGGLPLPVPEPRRRAVLEPLPARPPRARFEQCFDRYHGCAVYRELLGERRVRRSTASAVLQVRSAMADGDGGFDPADDAGRAWERQLSRSVPAARPSHVPTPLVQLTVTRRGHRPVVQRSRTRPYPHARPLPQVRAYCCTWRLSAGWPRTLCTHYAATSKTLTTARRQGSSPSPRPAAITAPPSNT